VALCEIINRPAEFTSVEPFYVVPQEEYVNTRVLFLLDYGSVAKEQVHASKLKWTLEIPGHEEPSKPATPSGSKGSKRLSQAKQSLMALFQSSK